MDIEDSMHQYGLRDNNMMIESIRRDEVHVCDDEVFRDNNGVVMQCPKWHQQRSGKHLRPPPYVSRQVWVASRPR